MPNASAGSIADIVYSGINPFPVSVSGILSSLVNQQRFFVEQFTGDTIGATIAEKYQPAITNLSFANVMKLMSVQDMGIKSMSIGGNEINADNSNLMEMAKQFEVNGMTQLKALTKGLKLYRARG